MSALLTSAVSLLSGITLIWALTTRGAGYRRGRSRPHGPKPSTADLPIRTRLIRYGRFTRDGEFRCLGLGFRAFRQWQFISRQGCIHDWRIVTRVRHHVAGAALLREQGTYFAPSRRPQPALFAGRSDPPRVDFEGKKARLHAGRNPPDDRHRGSHDRSRRADAQPGEVL